MKRLISILLISIVLVLCISTVANAEAWEYFGLWDGKKGATHNRAGYDLTWKFHADSVEVAMLYVLRQDLSYQYLVAFPQRHGRFTFYSEGEPGQKVIMAEVYYYGKESKSPLYISRGVRDR